MATLSYATLLLSIEVTQNHIEELLEQVDEQRAIRDAEIRDALSQDATYKTIQKLTGLSRSAIIKIQGKGTAE